MYYARIREIDLQLNPQESIIYIPNKDPTYSAPLAMNRNANTLHFWWPKTLGCSNRQKHYGQSICKKITSQVENDLTVLRQFTHLHQRLELLTFCINTWIMYFLRTIPAEIFTENVQQWRAIWWQHRQFLGRHLMFPWELQNCTFAVLHESIEPNKIGYPR